MRSQPERPDRKPYFNFKILPRQREALEALVQQERIMSVADGIRAGIDMLIEAEAERSDALEARAR